MNARPGTSTAGSRVFDIQVHDQTLLRFDIIAAAGATLTAVYRDFSVTVPGPLLNVSFRAIKDNPVINGGRATRARCPCSRCCLVGQALRP